MASTSVDRRENLLKSCVKELQCCIEYVQKYSDEKEQHIYMLKDIGKQYCEIDIQHARARAACEATDRHFDNQENDCTEGVEQIYNKYLEEQPTNTTYTNHPIWRKINNATQSGPTQNTVEENDSDEDEDSSEEIDDDNRSIDEEGIIPTQFEPPVDPITKKPIENPCKNRKCGHVYEFSTIMDHLKRIKQNKTKPRCPYIGCTNLNMKSSFIIKDDMLKQQIQAYFASQSQTERSSQSILNLDL